MRILQPPVQYGTSDFFFFSYVRQHEYNSLSASVNVFQDGNGYIDEQELDALLRDLYQKNKKVRGVCEKGLAPTAQQV